MEEKEEKKVNTEELKSEASTTVNQVKDTIKNVDIKKDSIETKGFIAELFKDPLGKIKEIVDKDYDATISDMINVCIEDLLSKGSVKYYAKPEDEITIYRSVMIRKENAEALNKITQETGISLTRLVNIAMKEFLDKYNK